ncbi:hypothetical protein Tco_1404221 [Tanacetum coccineum]
MQRKIQAVYYSQSLSSSKLQAYNGYDLEGGKWLTIECDGFLPNTKGNLTPSKHLSKQTGLQETSPEKLRDSGSGSKSTTTKSSWKFNFPTFTKTSSSNTVWISVIERSSRRPKQALASCKSGSIQEEIDCSIQNKA